MNTARGEPSRAFGVLPRAGGKARPPGRDR